MNSAPKTNWQTVEFLDWFNEHPAYQVLVNGYFGNLQNRLWSPQQFGEAMQGLMNTAEQQWEEERFELSKELRKE